MPEHTELGSTGGLARFDTKNAYNSSVFAGCLIIFI
jgi:hypothetical protein